MVSARLGAPVTAPLLTQPVTVDGKWTSAAEWSDVAETKMAVAEGNSVGYLRVKHGPVNLFILGDFPAATSLRAAALAVFSPELRVVLVVPKIFKLGYHEGYCVTALRRFRVNPRSFEKAYLRLGMRPCEMPGLSNRKLVCHNNAAVNDIVCEECRAWFDWTQEG